MRPITVCPSTLALGFSTYCPLAKRLLFDGKAVSHIFPEMSPKDLDADRLQDTVQHIGRISLSGVQPKFSAIVGEDLSLRYTRDNERGHFILKPQPSSYHIINREFCAAKRTLPCSSHHRCTGLRPLPTDCVSTRTTRLPILGPVVKC